MKKQIDRVIMVILSIILILSSILIDNTNSYYKYLRIAGYGLMILYIIIRFIQKEPIKIVQNKLDICVLLLVISTTIPVICNTYVSLSGSIQTILQYMYVYCIYLIFREMVQKKDGFSKIIVNLLIIVTIIMIIVGIDGITSNQFSNLLDKIGKNNFLNGENRLISIFGYPNILATYIASILFLNINEYLKQTRQEIKAIYKTITLVFIIGILLTYSKAIFVILPLSLITYIVMIKDSNKRIEIIQNIIITFIMSILFLMMFDFVNSTQNYLLMWITIAIILLTNYLINVIIEKINLIYKERITKINMIFFLGIMISFVIYILVGLNIYDEYAAFTEKIESDYEAKIINHIKGNTEYVFEFDLEANAPKDIENTYTINLIERNDKNQEINQTEIQFGTYEGTKTIKIITKEETSEVKIEFQSEYPYSQKKLIIKSFYINQKEIPLKYKYLPTKLIEKVQNIEINYKTIKERIVMIKDAMELAKDTLLTGIGGQGWTYKYQEVQSYSYVAKILHSYTAKVILEFGILGILAYIGIAIIVMKILIKLVKNQEVERLSILFAFVILAIHSIIDIDMEYVHILLYTFCLMGVLSAITKKEDIKQGSNISNSVFVIIFVISIFFTVKVKLHSNYGEIDELIREQNGLAIDSEKYKTLNYQIAKKYEEIGKYERYGELLNYDNIINYTLNSNCPNVLDILEKYYEKIDDYKKKNNNNIDSIMSKMKCIYNIVNELERQNNVQYNAITEKFVNMLIKECEEIKEQNIMNDTNLHDLEQIYEKVNQIKDTYLLGVKIFNDSNISIQSEDLDNIEIEESRGILLYHTHGTESYKSNTPYESYEFYKSLDENYNVMKVGDSLTELLENKGITIIHNRTYHNYPIKIDTYAQSRKTVQEILENNSNINRMIDIHRDAYSQTEHEASTIEINGEKVAPLRFVVGINREDKDWKYDLKWVIEMQKMADEKYPGLFHSILIREENYNQDLSKYATLIEVGENCNNIEEVLNSIKYFSKILL